jgi:signal transduction histidine kinase
MLPIQRCRFVKTARFQLDIPELSGAAGPDQIKQMLFNLVQNAIKYSGWQQNNRKGFLMQ